MLVTLRKIERGIYDTVPHDALSGKMHQLGIRGRVLEFVKALCASSTVSVQMGGFISEPFPLLRGLRQGCPLSPVLLDIVIGWERTGKTWGNQDMGVE